MRLATQILLWISRGLIVVSTFGGMMMAAVIVVSSAMRYVLGAPLAYQEELVGLFFVVLVFMALPYCSLKNKHIRVTAITDMLSGYWRKVAELASLIFVLIFSVVFARLSFNFALVSYQIGALSDVGDIILYPWMMLMPIGCSIMGLVVLSKIIRYILDWKKDFVEIEEDDYRGM